MLLPKMRGPAYLANQPAGEYRMAPSSFSYTDPWFPSDGPRLCPNCQQAFNIGENVHWYSQILWHTKPCP
jgi:hypothetical protein